MIYLTLLHPKGGRAVYNLRPQERTEELSFKFDLISFKFSPNLIWFSLQLLPSLV